MKHIESTVEIDATPEQVWSVLTDLAAFAEWNPFILEASGELREGGRLSVRIQPPRGRVMGFRPTVTELDPGRELRWLGKLGVRGVFDGEHSHHLEPAGAGATRYTQSERFSGLLTWFASGTLKKTLHGFEAMNIALKQRVERARIGRS
jgi:hypothetical protein